MKKHKIQWLNIPGYKGETWNPIIGCSKVSDGCKNCYAEKMAHRIANIELSKLSAHSPKRHYGKVIGVYSGAKWKGNTHFVRSTINKPLHWKKPRVIFVCSMGDLFHEDTSFQDIDKVFATMAASPQHIFIVLTKRAKRMQEYFNWKDTSWENKGMQGDERIRYYAWHNHGTEIEFENWQWPLQNVWLGVSAENQQTANERIPKLIKVPAAVKLVSVEPMIGKIDISPWLYSGYIYPPQYDVINWVICGGESGNKARPMHPDWVRNLRDQCQAANVPFFVKQWGELLPKCQVDFEYNEKPKIRLTKLVASEREFQSPNNPRKKNTYFKLGKHHSGNWLDGERWEQYPQPETLNPKP